MIWPNFLSCAKTLHSDYIRAFTRLQHVSSSRTTTVAIITPQQFHIWRTATMCARRGVWGWEERRHGSKKKGTQLLRLLMQFWWESMAFVEHHYKSQKNKFVFFESLGDMRFWSAHSTQPMCVNHIYYGATGAHTSEWTRLNTPHRPKHQGMDSVWAALLFRRFLLWQTCILLPGDRLSEGAYRLPVYITLRVLYVISIARSSVSTASSMANDQLA